MRRSHARSSLLAIGIGALGLVVLTLWLSAARAALASGPIVVNSLADTSGACAASGTGICTLRDALSFANLHPGADAINFSVGGTILLTASLPAISGTLTINGGGAVTVSGAGAHTVLTINNGADVDLEAITIANGHISGGDGGGGIDNIGGTLTVINSTVTNNSASSSGGGGIENGGNGTVTVINTTIVSNTALSGGGIDNSGTGNVTVTGSLLMSNTAGSGGGGIENSGTETVTVSNSTFVSDTATYFGGGIDNSGTGNVVVTNGTLVSNGAPFFGGNVENRGTETLVLQNTLLAHSLSGGDCGGTVTADAHNLADGHTCASATFVNLADLKLGPPQNNGGSTWTIALGPGSVAIGAGNSAVCPATDQRGVSRLGSCDVGAYEYAVAHLLYLPLLLK